MKLLIVIHIETKEQALEQSTIAFENGADGIFLISHSKPYSFVLNTLRYIRETFPMQWIGINCLDLEPIELLYLLDSTINGIWADNAHINEFKHVQDYATEFITYRSLNVWKGLYFGGVAFKYQQPVTDLVNVVNLAVNYMDVVTTSGPGTGHAPTIKKINTMCDTIDGKGKLAIASGITPDNVHLYSRVDYVLVATGISTDFHHLDSSKVQQLVKNIKLINQGKL